MGLLKIGALWKKEGQNGKHLSGNIKEEVTLPTGARIFCFPVREKSNENSPDFEICLQVEDQDQPRQGGKFQGRGGNGQNQGGGYQGNRGGNQGGGSGQQRQQNQNQGGSNRGNGKNQQPDDFVDPDDLDF
jgi:hypothetical protein